MGEILDNAEELRYFIDQHRWFREQPKLSTATSGLTLWKEQVVAMDANNFQKWAERFKRFMTMFWTQTSSQSRAFREQFGTILHQMGGPTKVPFGQVDCLLQGDVPQGESGQPIKAEINRKLCSMHDVTGVPTLVWFDFTNYNGDLKTYNSTWTQLEFEQVTIQGVKNFLKTKNVHAEL